MAYKAHTLIAFGGSLSEVTTGDEIWECTIRAISPGGSELPLSDPGGYMDQIAGDLASWFSDSDNNMANGTTLAWLKVNNIGPDGRYSGGATNVHDYTPAIEAGVGQSVPSFCSLAFSWTTNRKRPPGAFGRIYPPNYTYPCIGSAISGVYQAKALATAVALLDVIRACSHDLQAIPVIASRVNATNTEITGVRVGNVYDYQSRRKNAVRETYTAQAWDSSCN